MASPQPVRSFPRQCCLCDKSCSYSDKVFNLLKNGSLLLAFQKTVGPVDCTMPQIICDSCKRKVVSVDSNLTKARHKVHGLLQIGELSVGPATTNLCRICRNLLKSTFFSLHNFIDVVEEIAETKIQISAIASRRLCSSCKTLLNKVATSLQLGRELAATYQKATAASKKRNASTPAAMKAQSTDVMTKRRRIDSQPSPETRALAQKLIFSSDTPSRYRPIAIRPHHVAFSEEDLDSLPVESEVRLIYMYISSY